MNDKERRIVRIVTKYDNTTMKILRLLIVPLFPMFAIWGNISKKHIISYPSRSYVPWPNDALDSH